MKWKVMSLSSAQQTHTIKENGIKENELLQKYYKAK